jgi:mannose-6-phosphate isomerase-like protein (cupin superfamily)
MTTHPMPPVTFEPDEIADLTRAPLGTIPGVVNTTLWSDGVSATGLLDVGAGHQLGRHRHRRHCHHMWIVSGHAEILDRPLGPGSYAYVPVGIEHDIDARHTEGVRVFYSYTVPVTGLV